MMEFDVPRGSATVTVTNLTVPYELKPATLLLANASTPTQSVLTH